MPSGAAVIRYEGKRGVVWRIKYIDAAGDQVQETLGKSSDGWNRRKAESALRNRLTDVERDGYRRPEPTTFESFARSWLADYAEAEGLKRSTRYGYENILDRHLVPAFGRSKLSEIDVDAIDRYVVAKRRGGLAPGTVNRQLNVLSLILGAAARRRLVAANAVALVRRPKEPRKRWRIFTPEEVGRVERAFGELVAEAQNDRHRDDAIVARRLFVLHMGTGVRRGEAAVCGGAQ